MLKKDYKGQGFFILPQSESLRVDIHFDNNTKDDTFIADRFETVALVKEIIGTTSMTSMELAQIIEQCAYKLVKNNYEKKGM